MKEFICIECGTKRIDRGIGRGKKFCCEACCTRWHNKQRGEYKGELVCRFNVGVSCFGENCDRCGWSPAKKARAVKVRPMPENKFCYDHPDAVKRWLKGNPCTGCKASAFCDRPCPIYLHWYNARMRVIRKKVGYERP